MKPTSKPLGSFRKRFFPIYNHELPQILPLFMLFFLVTMNYGILRTMKEALITARGGSKLIAQVKLWAVVPILFFFKFVLRRASRPADPGPLAEVRHGLLRQAAAGVASRRRFKSVVISSAEFFYL